MKGGKITFWGIPEHPSLEDWKQFVRGRYKNKVTRRFSTDMIVEIVSDKEVTITSQGYLIARFTPTRVQLFNRDELYPSTARNRIRDISRLYGYPWVYRAMWPNGKAIELLSHSPYRPVVDKYPTAPTTPQSVQDYYDRVRDNYLERRLTGLFIRHGKSIKIRYDGTPTSKKDYPSEEQKAKRIANYMRRRAEGRNRDDIAMVLGFLSWADTYGYPLPSTREEADRLNATAIKMGFQHVADAWVSNVPVLGALEAFDAELIEDGFGPMFVDALRQAKRLGEFTESTTPWGHTRKMYAKTNGTISYVQVR